MWVGLLQRLYRRDYQGFNAETLNTGTVTNMALAKHTEPSDNILR